jgi:hypothetical protein
LATGNEILIILTPNPLVGHVTEVPNQDPSITITLVANLGSVAPSRLRLAGLIVLSMHSPGTGELEA